MCPAETMLLRAMRRPRKAAPPAAAPGRLLKSLLIVGLTGGLGMGLGAYLFVYAIAEAGVGKVATLTSSSPLFGMAMAVVFLKEQVTWQMVVGMGLCLAGVWVVI